MPLIETASKYSFLGISFGRLPIREIIHPDQKVILNINLDLEGQSYGHYASPTEDGQVGIFIFCGNKEVVEITRFPYQEVNSNPLTKNRLINI